ncbi:putative very-long-chain 3-oxoacyl-CoA reductase [Helianthus annuus]|nr:putative very-long-chain 3-oxoacyl-CoA reductase [Helianthus annuus]
MTWLIAFKGKSGFSARNTAEDVTKGIDGHGLTSIITGPTSGIGLETARVLALRGVHVIMAARNVEAAAKCKETIIKDCPNATVDVMELDEEGADITVNALHPGVIATNLSRHSSCMSVCLYGLFKHLQKNIPQGKSGFSARNTAEDVTKGIDGHGLTAIITDHCCNNLNNLLVALVATVFVSIRSGSEEGTKIKKSYSSRYFHYNSYVS